MKRLFGVLIFSFSCALLSACSSGSSSGGSSSGSTYTLSGAMAVGTSFVPMNVKNPYMVRYAYAIDHLASIGALDMHGLAATQCSDGYYYQVYCLDFSDNPTAKVGSVTCSGSTGSFSVSGLPLNTGIGCIVRRSTDNSTFTTLGDLTIPAASLAGGTSTITSSGDVSLSVSVSNTGTVTTTVSSGGSHLNTGAPTTTGSKLAHGIYKIECGTTTSTDFDRVACLCQNSDLTGHYANQDACIAGNASALPAGSSAQYVEMNFYNAVPDVAVDTGNGNTVPAGTAVPVISVWQASDASTSLRGSGGEGAGTQIKDNSGSTVNLTWSSVLGTTATAGTALSWATGSAVTLGNGITANLTAAGAMPSFSTGTAGNWITWIQSVMTNSTGFTCTWAGSPAPSPASSDASCIAEFTNLAFNNNGTAILPRLRVDRQCGSTGCDGTVANARVYIDGMKFAYTDPWSGSQAAVTPTMDGPTVQVAPRFVFEVLQPTPDGGGGFTQNNGGDSRWYSCSNTAGDNADITDASCKAYNTGHPQTSVVCGMSKSMAIHFVPTTTNGTFKVVFNQSSVIQYAEMDDFTTNPMTKTYGPAVMALCTSKLSNQDAQFYMDAVKQ